MASNNSAAVRSYSCSSGCGIKSCFWSRTQLTQLIQAARQDASGLQQKIRLLSRVQNRIAEFASLQDFLSLSLQSIYVTRSRTALFLPKKRRTVWHRNLIHRVLSVLLYAPFGCPAPRVASGKKNSEKRVSSLPSEYGCLLSIPFDSH